MSGGRGPVLWLVGGPAGGLARVGAWTGDDAAALGVGLVLAGLVFAVDLLTGFSSALPVLYGAALLAVSRCSRPALLPAAALLVSVLTLAGFAFAPFAAIGDRLLSLAAIAAAAALLGRWRADRAALAGAQAEAARQAAGKSRFLSAAGHDLRHPLQAGVLFHDLLSRRLRGSPHEELVIGVGRALEMQRRMLDGLLEVSRLDAGQVDICPVRFALVTLFERLEAEFAPLAAEGGLSLAVVPTGAVVVTDPDLLGRILRALLDNAIKYTRRGGVLLGCRRRGRMVSIQVWDSGIGIPPGQLREVFEEFRQLRMIAHDGGKGLGLGLPVAERLARAIGHPLGVRSAPDRGSVFEVVVPLAGG